MADARIGVVGVSEAWFAGAGRRLRGLPLALGLALAVQAAHAEGPRAIPMLVYHRFDARAAASTTVSLAGLKAQLGWLEGHGYRIVPLRQAVADLTRAEAPPEAAITVDDGHRSVYEVLFPLVRARRIPVTLFIYPSAISNASYALTWNQLAEMRASGLVDIESHTYWHPNFKTEKKRLSAADYGRFVDLQLSRSKATLENRLGARVDLLAWPFGIVDAELESAAGRAGYTAAFAYEGGPARAGGDLLALPRIPVSDADRGARFGALIAVHRPAAPR